MILPFYKPIGYTSFDLVARVRKKLAVDRGVRAKSLKVGHAGTLDPLAEGVLIVLTDSDTKRQEEFMHQKKCYLCEIALGFTSATYDLEAPLEKKADLLGSVDAELKAKILQALPKFTGKILQQVPPYSAVKVGGKRLYSLARKADAVMPDLPVKEVEVFEIKMFGLDRAVVLRDGEEVEPFVLTLQVTCGSGTYIRSLAHDLGRELEVGGVLVKLVRTAVGDFKASEALDLDAWLEA